MVKLKRLSSFAVVTMMTVSAVAALVNSPHHSRARTSGIRIGRSASPLLQTTNDNGKDTEHENRNGFVESRDRALVERTTRLMGAFLERDRMKRNNKKSNKSNKKRKERKSNRFRFATTVTASTLIPVTQTEGSSTSNSGITLDQYMDLPLDDYILLDENILSVSRMEDGTGFYFKLPFGAMERSPGKKLFAGILEGVADALCAECALRVQTDATNRKNIITGSNFKLTVINEDALEQAKAQTEADRTRLEQLSKAMTSSSTTTENEGDIPVATNATTTTTTLESMQQQQYQQNDNDMDIVIDNNNNTATRNAGINSDSNTNSNYTNDQRLEQMNAMAERINSLSMEEKEELGRTSSRTILKGLVGAAPEGDGTVVLQWGKAANTNSKNSMGSRLSRVWSNNNNNNEQELLLETKAKQPPISINDNDSNDDIYANGNADTTIQKIPLTAKLTINAELTLQIPVPRVVLNPLGSLVLKLAFNQVLPKILDIVREDYLRRASPERTAPITDGVYSKVYSNHNT